MPFPPGRNASGRRRGISMTVSLRNSQAAERKTGRTPQRIRPVFSQKIRVRLADAAAVRHGHGRRDQGQFSVFFGGQHHTVAHGAADLAGLEIEDGDDLSADQFFGLVELGETRENLTGLSLSEIDHEPQDAVGLGKLFADFDRADPEVAGLELIEGHIGKHRIVFFGFGGAFSHLLRGRGLFHFGL